ncbi:hypothetical protein ACH42_09600 [Endozoicomonas sp. (ex Bugula neritina AB1)]|nr:hypothetical protein ACH42_09600 [Endozoicomonas sp. (ex Bugula neritina AB1)]
MYRAVHFNQRKVFWSAVFLLSFYFTPSYGFPLEVCPSLVDYLEQEEHYGVLDNSWVARKSADNGEWDLFDLSDFCVIKRLGEGMQGFSLLVSSRNGENGPFSQYTLKVFKNRLLPWPYDELNVHKALKGFSGLTQIYYIYALPNDRGNPFMTLEAANNITLEEFIQGVENDQIKLDPESLVKIAIDLLELITEMHLLGVSHNDLRNSNIMFDHHGALKFIDYNMAETDSANKQGVFKAFGDVYAMRYHISNLVSVAKIPEKYQHYILNQTQWMDRYKVFLSEDSYDIYITWDHHMDRMKRCINSLKARYRIWF